ncbi:MAG: homocitrate synthase, partial [Hyphomicrobium sp.]
YQVLDPAMLGLSHRFVIGKHSGLAAVAACLSDLRLEAKPAECIELLARVRQHAVRTKRSVTDEELATFLEDIRRPARLEVATRAAANR